MTTMTEQSKRWVARVVVCAVLLIALPFGPGVLMVLADPNSPPYWAVVAWALIGLVLWWFIKERIMSRPYICPQCGGSARFERSEELFYLVCSSCPFREPSPFIRIGEGG